MKLAVVSHKLCWPSASSPTGFATDGGFPLQIEAISELFDETSVVVPTEKFGSEGLSPIKGIGMKVVPLSMPSGRGLQRKLGFPFWLIRNSRVIWKTVRESDAVHTPIPGDVGTIGMLFALLMRKPLFVRHCGNWLVQKTVAERFWKWSMEYFGGGKNVMLATGGSADPPSQRNENIKWIFSTSLKREQLANGKSKELPGDGRVRLVIACRQEERKGTDIVIASMPSILRSIPNATLDVIGDGALLPKLKKQAISLGLNDNIRFHGKVVHSKVIDLMSKGHLFCYPTNASEGFPKVVLEALASGLPVITTKVSVLPDLIRSGGGVILNSPNASGLAETVLNICSDSAKYEEMSSMAIEVARQYSLESWRDFIGETLRDAWNVRSLSNLTESRRRILNA